MRFPSVITPAKLMPTPGAPSPQLEVMLCQAAFGMTRSWWTVASQAATLANFYLSTWEEYHTGGSSTNMP